MPEPSISSFPRLPDRPPPSGAPRLPDRNPPHRPPFSPPHEPIDPPLPPRPAAQQVCVYHTVGKFHVMILMASII